MSGPGIDRLREIRAGLEAEMARVVERAESDPPVWLPDGENTGPGTGGTDRRGTAGEETAANGRGDEEYYNPRSWLV